MKYISVELFKSQSEKVQMELRKINTKDTDLFVVEHSDGTLSRPYLWIELLEVFAMNEFGKVYPLLDEEKLRRFIESKTKLPVCLNPRYLNHKIEYQVEAFEVKGDYYLKSIMKSNIYENPIYAYWEIACKLINKITNIKI